MKGMDKGYLSINMLYLYTTDDELNDYVSQKIELQFSSQ